MSNEDPLVRVDDVYKNYGDEEVLNGVSFEIERGDVEVLVGPSGSGKSTLLRCINQLTKPDEGDVYLDGEQVTAPEYDVNELRRQVGMVFQDFNLFMHLTAAENITLGLKRVRGMSESEAEAEAMERLREVGLEPQADSYPAELSGGQKQRVGIARALAMDPKLILFDEPTSALDPELIGEVTQVMRKLAEEGMTMLVVTHEMGFATEAASKIMFLDDGDIAERGPPDKMFQDPDHDRTKQFLERITRLHGETEAPQ
ncbi:MAG: polar amino acid transport system ATP-binding protein [Halobacteriales archaeon]|jgi:polar amino acid transport system ATP-binding protein